MGDNWLVCVNHLREAFTGKGSIGTLIIEVVTESQFEVRCDLRGHFGRHHGLRGHQNGHKHRQGKLRLLISNLKSKLVLHARLRGHCPLVYDSQTHGARRAPSTQNSRNESPRSQMWMFFSGAPTSLFMSVQARQWIIIGRLSVASIISRKHVKAREA